MVRQVGSFIHMRLLWWWHSFIYQFHNIFFNITVESYILNTCALNVVGCPCQVCSPWPYLKSKTGSLYICSLVCPSESFCKLSHSNTFNQTYLIWELFFSGYTGCRYGTDSGEVVNLYILSRSRRLFRSIGIASVCKQLFIG